VPKENKQKKQKKTTASGVNLQESEYWSSLNLGFCNLERQRRTLFGPSFKFLSELVWQTTDGPEAVPRNHDAHNNAVF
jgi:hypothetical protein